MRLVLLLAGAALLVLLLWQLRGCVRIGVRHNGLSAAAGFALAFLRRARTLGSPVLV
jgi:hypothetical protein